MSIPVWHRYSRRKLAKQMNLSEELSPASAQYQQFIEAWQRQQVIEEAVTQAALARSLTIEPQSVDVTRQALAAELPELGLTVTETEELVLHQTLLREQLNWVQQQAPLPDDAQVEAWYRGHAQHFIRPEQRYTRHLLLTVEGNSPAVHDQIEAIAHRVRDGHELFAREALRYSHCPSAMGGGVLGWVGRGILYPQLEDVLFRLEAGQLSTGIETELGWHLLLCEQIRLPQPLPKADALLLVRQQLTSRQQKQFQRHWIRQLISA
ncbi:MULTISPECIES: nitrogen fixation protein NifM [Rahnella]|uniref:peptidylprolyl isomerase n=1 Tax=Rahnella victoriana TaxID=1510570 RepID=A0ABS0DZY3_9GAMM|nr:MULTISPECIES: nitrogen fixation protein NifM [Rahnella]MBF7957698.1 nitrogen fixation protein NifM [Rahnella victoriana]TDS97997.1 peptidyl-prolyl cis-trans isomerase C [Rahnella sp. BIGb0236]